jgi:hypothetical protein
LFSIKVSSIKATLGSGFSFTSGDSNYISYTLTPTTGSAVTLSATAQTPTTAWTISNSGSLSVTHAGTLTKITKDLGTATEAFTISYTFASVA